MKDLIAVVLIPFAFLLFGEATREAIAERNGKELTELQKLKAENFQLKISLTNCQVAATNGKLTVEQQKLIEEFRQQLDARPEQDFYCSYS